VRTLDVPPVCSPAQNISAATPGSPMKIALVLLFSAVIAVPPKAQNESATVTSLGAGLQFDKRNAFQNAMRRLRLCLSVLLVACAPRTQLGSVSADQILIEQARQQQFALENLRKQQLRLVSVASPLLTAAVPLCGNNVRPVSAFLAGNAHFWKNQYQAAARAMGYSDTLVVMHVTPGLAAAEAGLRVDDRILAIDGKLLVIGPDALKDLYAKLPSPKVKAPRTYALTYRRGEIEATVNVRPQLACSYSPQLVEADEINAYADGQSIYLTSGILRFLADDKDLAVVVGHELAHDAMHHIEAKLKNSIIGALVGAVVDVAAATQGINTHGDFSDQGAKLGSMVFSQDFEREADYVGLYILALAGHPLDDAPNVWRQMAVAHPGSIKFATSHPTTAERFVRLETWRAEIARKVALGQPLVPEMKGNKNALASVPAVGVASTPALVTKGRTEAAVERSTSQVATPIVEDNQPATMSRAATVETVTAMPVAKKEAVRLTTAKVESRTSLAESPVRGARAIIGAPSSDSARLAATDVYAEAKAYMGQHLWNKAEASFRETLLLDGSIAKYHAELASLLMILGRYEEAEAEYSAALLLDVDNVSYRRLLKAARSKR
jgi:hypothetical protein